MLKDFEIAKKNKMKPIVEVASNAHISPKCLQLYGNYKAKVNIDMDSNSSKLVLVTSINPTPYGEGKTTVAIGLHDAFSKKGISSMLTLREPSLGPVFGVKGGACGGGYAQVVPMEDINLHFNGDFHAITTANNLISAAIDNSIYQGNPLSLNPEEIYFTRAMDMNDRVLREITIGKGPKVNGVERTEHFTITAACEIMSTLCMAVDIKDLRTRIDKIIVGKTYDGNFVYVRDLNITGSVLALLKDAIHPNLVQTLEGNLVFVHGGPFANIAPGCNSIRALKMASSISSYVITEAGFGFDLGGFKFLDIVARNYSLTVSSIVLVVTLKAIKHHANNNTLSSLEQLRLGFSNVRAHLDNLVMLQIPFVVTLNQYESDTEEEISLLEELLQEYHTKLVLNTVFLNGGEGALELCDAVMACQNEEMHYLYENNCSLKEKILIVCKKLLHAKDVLYTEKVLEKIADADYFFPNLPICIAKTQYSLSDDKKLLGYPKDFSVTVKDIRVYHGAGFITVYLGDILTMPGLPKEPAACLIDVVDGEITNIF